MKISDIRQKQKSELTDELANLRKEQMNLRFRQAAGQMENTARMRMVRRTIARIKTIMSEQRASARKTV